MWGPLQAWRGWSSWAVLPASAAVRCTGWSAHTTSLARRPVALIERNLDLAPTGGWIE